MSDSQFTKRRFGLFICLLLVFVLAGAATGIAMHFYVGNATENGNTGESMADYVKIGDTFTIDDIAEKEEYVYGWLKSDVKVTVEVITKDEDGNEKYVTAEDVLNYDEESRTFSVLGIGKGIIRFESTFDSSVNFSVEFNTRFAVDDTENILRENFPGFFDDGIVTNAEIDSVKSVTLSQKKNYDVSETTIFKNLERVILTYNDVVGLQGRNSLGDVVFYVADSLYTDYISDDLWKGIMNRIYPIVDLSENKNTVVLEFMGGTLKSVGEDAERTFVSVDNGGKLNLDEYAPSMKGYLFSGWFRSEDGGKTLSGKKVESSFEFKENDKLYASWSPITYEIVYNDPKFHTVVPDKEMLTYDKEGAITVEMLTHEGYTFMGWSKSEEASYVDYLPGKEVINLTEKHEDVINLYAVWAANSYDIIYDANTGKNAPAALTGVNFDEVVKLSEQIPVKEGFTFIGWSTNKNAISATYQPGDEVKNLVSDVDGNVTLYAVWTANSYTIHYDANGGQNAPEDQHCEYGQSVTITSKKPTMTGFVFKGWSRDKNAAAAAYVSGETVKNLVTDEGGSVTFYAVWDEDSFGLKYNANGGTNASSKVVYYEYNESGRTLSNNKPTRTGYYFLGWSYAADEGVVYSSGQTLTVSQINDMYMRSLSSNKTLTLYAVWEKMYKVTVSTSEASVSGVTNGAYYRTGTKITINVKYTHGNTKVLKVDGKDLGGATSYTFEITDHDIAISAGSSKNCIASGSLITMADGSKKQVEYLNIGDEVLTLNHETGLPEKSVIVYIENDGYDYYETLTLNFEGGVSVKVMSEHGFFDCNLNKYVMISLDNAGDFVGHEFYYLDGNETDYVADRLVLESYSIEKEYLDTYSFVTAVNYNHFVNGMLGLAAGIDGIYNIFEVDENMAYVQDLKDADIEKYGLYTYDDWSEYLTYEEFVAYNVKYMKVAVGKGMITEEGLKELIFKYLR